MHYLVIPALLCLTGRATTMQGYSDESAYWQRRADEVTTALHVPSVMVKLTNGVNGEYVCGQPIQLGTGPSINSRWLLAHELGHAVLGHCGGASLAREQEANAFAIKALQIWGDSEQQAVTYTMRHLMRLQRDGRVIHDHDFCAEVADVLRRFPQSPDPRLGSAPTCDTEISVVRGARR